jgi:uncharacterized membrane-anchored protein
VKNKNGFLIAMVIPVFILLGMAVQPLLTLFWGQEILLETRPFDPRDIFRGDYVNLSYQIEEVPIEKFPAKLLSLSENTNEKTDYRKVQKVYGVLKETNGYMVIDYITLEKPKDKIFIKGNLPVYNAFLYRDKNSNYPVFVNFGLDKYFVPENTGTELEDASRQGKIAARVKVYNGYALLVGLSIQ